MKNVSRRLGMILLAAASCSLVGCGSAGGPGAGEGQKGELALPLVTQGASGALYRLRDATFAIYSNYYWGAGGSGIAGAPTAGTGGGSGAVIEVSSETDPDAATISVPLEEGSYMVQLLPGWHFERDTPEGYEPVEATLLSGETQWVWVSRRSTSFAEYQFGLGGREIWLNGELNIGVVVFEEPGEGTGGYAGGGGYPGTGGYAVGGGMPAGGSASAGAPPSFGGTGAAP